MRRSIARRTAAAVTGFVSDIEGCMEFFDNFTSISQVLERHGDRLDFRRPGDKFVFGGDCFDHGTGDLRIGAMLVDLKKRYPDRVVLLMGNRDINKMKLTSELHPSELSRKPEDVPRAYFIPSGSPQLVTFAQYVAKHNIDPSKHHDAAVRLKWILSHTMGCTPTFEHRRAELAAMRSIGTTVDAISDDDVVDSFLNSLKEGGVVAEYLRHGQVAAVIDDTVFVHGAVNKYCVGFVPNGREMVERPYYHEEDLGAYSSYSEEERAAIGFVATPGTDIIRHEGASLHDWVDAMKTFTSTNVEEWLANPTFESAELPKRIHGGGVWGRRRGGTGLIGYPHRATMGKKTCVVQTFIKHGALQHVDLGTVACLNASGITRAVVGHQPAGETPSFISQPGLQVICADNSYCAAKTPTTRGAAVNEILVNSETGETRVHGRLVDGTAFDFAVGDSDPVIGRSTDDGWWTKAYRGHVDHPEVLLQRTKDAFHHVEYKWLPKADAEAAVASGFKLGGVGGSVDWGIRRDDLRGGQGGCGSKSTNTRIKTQVSRNEDASAASSS